MGFLFFLHMLFEAFHALLEIAVDIKVPFYYPFHSVYVLIHVILLVAEALQITDELTLLCEQLGCLLEVLEMFVSKFFFLFDQFVGLFVEGQQVWI